jgi:hypothetical protein
VTLSKSMLSFDVFRAFARATTLNTHSLGGTKSAPPHLDGRLKRNSSTVTIEASPAESVEWLAAKQDVFYTVAPLRGEFRVLRLLEIPPLPFVGPLFRSITPSMSKMAWTNHRSCNKCRKWHRQIIAHANKCACAPIFGLFRRRKAHMPRRSNDSWG